MKAETIKSSAVAYYFGVLLACLYLILAIVWLDWWQAIVLTLVVCGSIIELIAGLAIDIADNLGISTGEILMHLKRLGRR